MEKEALGDLSGATDPTVSWFFFQIMGGNQPMVVLLVEGILRWKISMT
jgi:hypothetical protein